MPVQSRPAAIASIALAAAVAAPPAAAAAASQELAISPPNGTQDASPRTQISVLGVPRRAIASVTVSGSSSGRHDGRLRRYSGDRGASFVLRRPLAAGERVRAVVRIRGGVSRTTRFTVARAGAVPPILRLATTQPDKLEHFVSRPGLLAPRIAVNKPGPSGDGSILLTPLPSPVVHPGSTQTVTISPVGPGGPMIVDGSGRLVWFEQLAPPDVAANLRVQRYRGRRVLTWWQGPVTAAAFGLGEGVIADSSYRRIATVRAGNGYAMDLHELALTPDGDALFTVYSPVLVHLAGTPAGARAPLLDAIVEEVDIRTGLVVWEWHALGHIPLSDSYATPANSAAYDAYHINAIQPLAHDRVLISARDTSAVYDVDRATGRILWTLGGKASDFRLGPGARFWFQHDAQLLRGDRLSVFDDEAGPPMKAPYSRGIVLALDLRHRRATLVRSYHRDTSTSAQSEGSVQTLPSGGVFVGFGSEPFFSQFSAGGRLVFDASLPADDGSYRAYRFGWSATPRTRPDIAARRGESGSTSVYASWNGATRVARWQVLAGADAGSLAPVAASPRTGFETRIQLFSDGAVFAVRALDAHGRVLATSQAVPAS